MCNKFKLAASPSRQCASFQTLWSPMSCKLLEGSACKCHGFLGGVAVPAAVTVAEIVKQGSSLSSKLTRHPWPPNTMQRRGKGLSIAAVLKIS